MTPDPIILDRTTGIVTCGERTARLTGKEAAVFCAIADRNGQVALRDAIYAEVWTDEDNLPEIRIVDVLVCKIRSKLDTAGIQPCIGTIWGRGFCVKAGAVRVVPVDKDEITIRGSAVKLLRDLLTRTAARPADALLSEQVRQAVFGI